MDKAPMNISEEEREFLTNLSEVLTKATEQWTDEVAKLWLTGTEPFLSGAKPIDVLRQGRVKEVMEALEAMMAGSYS